MTGSTVPGAASPWTRRHRRDPGSPGVRARATRSGPAQDTHPGGSSRTGSSQLRMSEHPDQSGIATFSRFDADAASKLRGNLAVISRHTDSEELRGLIRRVLSGKEHVRAVFGHPAFTAMAAPRLENLVEGIRQLDPQARAEVFERGGPPAPTDAELDALRSSD